MSALQTLNDTLIFQMGRLMDAKGEELEREIIRSRQVSSLAGNIILNHKNAIDLMRFQAQEEAFLDSKIAVPKMLTGGR